MGARGDATRPANDVRGSLIAAAVAEVTEVGPERASLRSIARRVGISHQAVAYHFADRAALLTAVAVDGLRDLSAEFEEALAEDHSDKPLGTAVAAVGERYIRFAREHPARFTLMFGAGLVDADDAELVTAKLAIWDQHLETVRAAHDAGWGSDVSPEALAVTTRALVHGLATLGEELAFLVPGLGPVEDILQVVNGVIVGADRASQPAPS